MSTPADDQDDDLDDPIAARVTFPDGVTADVSVCGVWTSSDPLLARVLNVTHTPDTHSLQFAFGLGGGLARAVADDRGGTVEMFITPKPLPPGAFY